jgi:hypothetical protein
MNEVLMAPVFVLDPASRYVGGAVPKTNTLQICSGLTIMSARPQEMTCGIRREGAADLP